MITVRLQYAVVKQEGGDLVFVRRRLFITRDIAWTPVFIDYLTADKWVSDWRQYIDHAKN